MPEIIERDILLTGKDEQGRTTMDFPVTRLELVEGGAEELNAIHTGDFVPVIHGEKMKRVPIKVLQTAVNSAVPEASGSTAGLMTAQDKKKLDGIVEGATKNTPSDEPPAAMGDASAGTSEAYARADHVHPMPSFDQLSGAVFHAGTTPPENTGLLWIDTTADIYIGGLKYYNGTEWVHVPVSSS